MNLAPAQRWANILLGGAVVALVAVLAFKSVPRPAGAGNAAADAAASPSKDDAGADAEAPSDLAGVGNAGNAGNAGDPLLDAIGASPDSRAQNGVGSRMADGAPVPPLPANAPRAARFGVVLVGYAGAQGAPPNARSRQEATDLARTIAEQAKIDFRAAVGRGDPGSSADVGRVPRGVLELAPEYVLFTLPAGGVSEPVDTPRGFWIIQRIE